MEDEEELNNKLLNIIKYKGIHHNSKNIENKSFLAKAHFDYNDLCKRLSEIIFQTNAVDKEEIKLIKDNRIHMLCNSKSSTNILNVNRLNNRGKEREYTNRFNNCKIHNLKEKLALYNNQTISSNSRSKSNKKISVEKSIEINKLKTLFKTTKNPNFVFKSRNCHDNTKVSRTIIKSIYSNNNTLDNISNGHTHIKSYNKSTKTNYVYNKTQRIESSKEKRKRIPQLYNISSLNLKAFHNIVDNKNNYISKLLLTDNDKVNKYRYKKTITKRLVTQRSLPN